MECEVALTEDQLKIEVLQLQRHLDGWLKRHEALVRRAPGQDADRPVGSKVRIAEDADGPVGSKVRIAFGEPLMSAEPISPKSGKSSRDTPSDAEAARNRKRRQSAYSHTAPSMADDSGTSCALDGFRRERASAAVAMEAEDEERKTVALAEAILDAKASQVNTKEESRVRTSWRLRSKIHWLVQTTHFELFFAMAIITNSLLIGASVEYQAQFPHDETPLTFYVIAHFFAVLFLVELSVRWFAEGCGFWCSQTRWWNYLDAFIVTSSLFEVATDYLRLTGGEEGAVGSVGNVRVLRIIRVTRLIRILRITRIMRFVRALRTLVYSILVTLKSLVWAMLLLIMIIYLFAILFTQAISEHLAGKPVGESDDGCSEENSTYLLQRYWGSIMTSMTTLYQAISGGVSWDVVAYPLYQVHTTLFLLFCVFIAFAYFAVLNVVTGVFCQSAIESTQRDQDLQVQAMVANRKMYVDKIQKLFKNIDSQDSGYLTLKEFEEHLAEPAVQAYFATLELDTADAWTLFKLIDCEKANKVDVNEFIDGCMRLKGSAKSIDIACIMQENKWMRRKITDFIAYVELQFQILGGEAIDDALSDGTPDTSKKTALDARRLVSPDFDVWEEDEGVPLQSNGIVAARARMMGLRHANTAEQPDAASETGPMTFSGI